MLAEKFHHLIRLWERECLASNEFFDQMLDHLQKLPVPEKRATVEALAAHVNPDIRRMAAEFQVILHHKELSRNPDYVRQHSPLRPGTRLELFGGYDYYSTRGKPWWLNGREYYQAIFLGFAFRGENMILAGLVEFDEVIDVPGHKGRYGILLAGYSSLSVAWGQTEDTVAVYLVEALPEDLAAASFSYDSAIETHATYRVEGTASLP